MSDISPTQVVGSEGLRGDSLLASQVSSVEKLSAQDRESIRRELEAERVRVDTMVASLRHERELVTAAIQKNLDDREQSLRRERELVGEKIRAELDAAITAARETATAANNAAVEKQEMEVSRLEALIESVRMVGMADVERIQEVKNLHWAEHTATHEQEGEAVRVAVDTVRERLHALNELRQLVSDRDKTFAPLRMVEEMRKSTSERIDREALDSRLRFERNDKESAERFNRLASEIQASNARLESLINSKFESSGEKWRTELRPVQDAKVGQAAVIAALFGAVSLIVFAIALFNFLAKP